MKQIFSLFIFFTCLQLSYGQHATEIEWIDFEEAIELQAKTHQKLFLFIYTDWCDYCKYTKENTLVNPQFIKAVNTQFLPVKLNAETQDDIHFLDHDFSLQEESGYHELAIVLLGGEMTFPSFLFFNEELKIVSQVGGVQEDIIDFTNYVNYIGTDAYLTNKWSDYQSK